MANNTLPTEETLSDGTRIVYEIVENMILRERRYYPSGNQKSVCQYSRGIKSGHETIFADDSENKTIQTQSYFNSILYGYQTKFNANGSVIEQCCYRDGLLNGVKTIFDDEGNILSQVTYVNDVPQD
jgi:antitoxin component YwqK of YwqJK toxin-antitoxin module